ncbi:MAG: cytochrome c class [Edaphobacter sp.]|jgi:mono/diheme cytochrome c family protein|nr:cytochrome c class [Edaphobacter sp.]
MRLGSFFAVFGCVACLALAGCKVTPPGKAETAVVQWTKHTVTVGGKHDKNPVQSTPDKIEAGKQTFGFYCVVCHGRDGQNTGVPFAGNMSPPIPSLASKEIQRYSDGQLKWIIENGLSPSGMPAAKGILSDEDIWTIVVFLRHLPPAGSLGEPRTYSGDEYAK